MKKPYKTEICDQTGEVTAILRSKEDVIAFRNNYEGIDKVLISHIETLEMEGSYFEYYRPYILAMNSDPFLQKLLVGDLVNRFPEIQRSNHIAKSAKGGKKKKFNPAVMSELVTMFRRWKQINGNETVNAFISQLKKSKGKPESVILDSGAIIGTSSAKKYLNGFVKGVQVENPFQ